MNKITYSIGAGILILLLIVLGISYTTSPNRENLPHSQYLGPAGSSEITFNGEFPDNPSKMMVYVVVPQDTEKDAQQIAKQLGVNEELKRIDNYLLYGSAGEWNFEYLLPSSAFSYTISARVSGRNPSDMPEFLPGEKEAITIAEGYLKDQDLWEEDAVYDNTIYQYGYVLWGVNDTKQLVHQTMDVQFRRISNGYPIDGDGIRVSLGGHGDVIEVSKAWRTYIPDKEYQIITAEEAYQQLVKDHPTFPPAEGHPVTITGIYLGYVTRPRGETMDLMKPAYAFEYETEYDGDPMNGTWYIPAVPGLGNL